MAINNKVIGLTFPWVLDADGGVRLTEGKEVIASSVKLILGWRLNNRYFMYAYGSRLEEVLEEPNDNILSSLIREFVIESINTWEPRVEMEGLDITFSDGIVGINITYLIKSLGISDQLNILMYRN